MDSATASRSTHDSYYLCVLSSQVFVLILKSVLWWLSTTSRCSSFWNLLCEKIKIQQWAVVTMCGSEILMFTETRNLNHTNLSWVTEQCWGKAFSATTTSILSQVLFHSLPSIFQTDPSWTDQNTHASCLIYLKLNLNSHSDIVNLNVPRLILNTKWIYKASPIQFDV